VSRRRQGAAAIEAALVLPVLLILVAGIIEVSWYLHLRFALVDVAQRAVRSGAVTGDATLVTTNAEAKATQMLAAYGIRGGSVSATLDPGPPELVRVRVEVGYAALMGLVPTPTTVSAQAVDENEDPNNPG